MTAIIGKIELDHYHKKDEGFGHNIVPLGPDDPRVLPTGGISMIGIYASGEKVITYQCKSWPTFKTVYVTKEETFVSHEEAAKAVELASHYFQLHMPNSMTKIKEDDEIPDSKKRKTK